MYASDIIFPEHVMFADFIASYGPQNPSQISIYLAIRLTFLQYGSTLMGPMRDETGVELGGVSRSDHFQLDEDRGLFLTGARCLGLDLGETNVSSIGAANDEILVSTSLKGLQSHHDLSLKVSEEILTNFLAIKQSC